MKKLLTLAALFLTACTTSPATPPVESTEPTTTPPAEESPSNDTETPPTATSDVTSYHNETYGFSFEYPKAWKLSEVTEYLISAQVPASDYEGTNFEQASFNVQAMPAGTLDECLARPNGSESGFDKTKTTTINGNTYYQTTGNDSGMGHWGYLRFYNTWRGTTCFSFVETLVITNPAPEYHPTPFTELDENAVWARLDAILQTVGFDEA